MTRIPALLFVVASAVPAAAQNATLSGTVVDESGAGVPGATVQLAGPGGNTSTTSGPKGEYSFRDLARGTYRVTATLSGFSPGTHDGIVVDTSNVELAALTLKVGSLTDVI